MGDEDDRLGLQASVDTRMYVFITCIDGHGSVLFRNSAVLMAHHIMWISY